MQAYCLTLYNRRYYFYSQARYAKAKSVYQLFGNVEQFETNLVKAGLNFVSFQF